MKNILVLTDFSEVADNAAEYAVKLAAALKANLILVHAIAARESALVSPGMVEETEDNHDDIKNALFNMDILLKKLQITLKDEIAHKPQITCLALVGSIKDLIRKTVTEDKIDLIVMGARLYDEFPGFLVGTNVRGVVDAASVPILLVHEQIIFKQLHNIFFVTDLRYCDLKAVTLLVDFASRLKAGISMLHACADGLPCLSNSQASAIFQDMIAAHFDYGNLKCQNTDSIGVQSVINRVIESEGMDILAVSNKKYHFLNHLFRRNPEKDTAAFARIPVLIIPG